jgi:hypothetical protein
MYTLDIQKIPPEIQAKVLPDKGVIKEIKQLGTPGGASVRKLILYAERGLVSSPVAGRRGGGRGAAKIRRQWLPWTSAEFDVSVRLAARLPLTQVSESRGLALVLWGCRDFQDVLDHRADFHGKAAYEPFIGYWLGVFAANLKLLHSDILDPDRLNYFQSDALKVVVMGLTHGLYDVYEVDGAGNLIKTKAKPAWPDPEESLKSLPPLPATMGR